MRICSGLGRTLCFNSHEVLFTTCKNSINNCKIFEFGVIFSQVESELKL